VPPGGVPAPGPTVFLLILIVAPKLAAWCALVG
jgi:hypothetical protein